MGTILVTGATGVVGTFVVAELLARGHAVRALSREGRVDGATVVRGDLADLASLARAADGVDGIVHAAVTLTDAAIDIAAMRALLATRGPFVFVSSLDVYGLAEGLVTEETPVTESYNDYARGKVVCERLLDGRDGVSILRAPLVWGPHPTARKRLLGTRVPAGLPVVLPGPDYGDVWIDARDLAAIAADCLDRPCGTANVLAGHFAWRELYELLGCAIVYKPLAAITDDELPKKHLYAQTWRFSAARLERHLGARTYRSLATTVRDTVGP